jgi:hypothetical protein
LLTTADPITVDTTALGFVEIPISGSLLFAKEINTLSAGDITNQYIDLDFETIAGTVFAQFGGVPQVQTEDYTLSLVGLITRLTFTGDLATGGASELIAGDKLYVNYAY